MDEMTPDTRIQPSDKRFFHSATVTDATSTPLRVPSVGRPAVVSVTPGTNAKVQSTLSSYDAIEKGNAVWEDWPNGSITSQASATVEGGVSAIRLVSTGASTWRVTV